MVILLTITAVPVIYAGVWLWFITDGNIATGTELDKSDWLSFLGAFLTFIGTMFLGTVALWQNKKANKISERILDLEEAQYLPIIDILDLTQILNQKLIFKLANISKYDIKHAKIISDYVKDGYMNIYHLKAEKSTSKEIQYDYISDYNSQEREAEKNKYTNHFLVIEIENIFGMKFIEKINFKLKPRPIYPDKRICEHSCLIVIDKVLDIKKVRGLPHE